jgi:thiamine pyrophosphokinase
VSVTGTKWQLEEKELNRNNPYAISNEMSNAELRKEFPHVSFTCHTGMTVFYVAG